MVLPDKRRVRVPALRYNVALRLLEAQDSTGRHVWPPGSLDGFYLGRGPDARHFRSYAVRDGSTRTDCVEVLTVDDDSPLVLAVWHAYVHTDAEVDPILRTETRKARTEIGQTVLAGMGQPAPATLRPLALNQRSLERLFGTHAAAVAAFARQEQLRYTDLAQAMRMMEYYNQKLVSRPPVAGPR